MVRNTWIRILRFESGLARFQRVLFRFSFLTMQSVTLNNLKYYILIGIFYMYRLIYLQRFQSLLELLLRYFLEIGELLDLRVDDLQLLLQVADLVFGALELHSCAAQTGYLPSSENKCRWVWPAEI